MNLGSKYKIWQPFIFALIMCIGMIVGIRMAPQMYQSDLPSEEIDSNQAIKKFNEVIKYLESHYVDSIQIEGLSDQMIKNGILQLDPHSIYLSKEEVSRESDSREGKYTGIGLDFFEFNDTLIVRQVLDRSPADSAGIQVLDKLLAVNNVSLVDNSDLSAKSKLIRKSFAKLSDLKILREGVEIELELGSDEILVSPIPIAIHLNKVGFIKIDKFSQGTYKEFMQALEGLVTNFGITDLIIDVRDNPGGFMQDAIQILSQFFKQKDQLLVYTKTRDNRKQEYKSDGRNFFDINKLVILINQNSASASEIIAGVIQDLDRGKIIGETSFGKGLVQQQFDLSDGSAIVMTTERYYTPSGRLIQKPYRKKADVFRSQASEDTMNYYTRKGNVVNAAGGITPDIMVEQIPNKMLRKTNESNFGFSQTAYMFRNLMIAENEISNRLRNEFLTYYLAQNNFSEFEFEPNVLDYIKNKIAFEYLILTEGIERAIEWEIKQDYTFQKAIETINDDY